jgi:hypothetical protein
MAETTAKKLAILSSEDNAEWENYMDAAYASLAGFQMKEDGLVVKVGDCRELHRPFPNRNRRNKLSRRRQ